ncbi:MAG: ribonuclease III [Cyanobacteria bacterium J06639_1]
MNASSLPSHRHRALERLLRRCGLAARSRQFEAVDWMLVDIALTHPSVDRDRNNDRLEFLGDAVLRIVVGDWLFQQYPDLEVGNLSALRAELLSNAFFAHIADRYEFDESLAIGNSARHDAKGRQKRLADALEAWVGALYLSWQSAGEAWLVPLQTWLEPHLRDRADRVLQNFARHNAKTALQELTQGRWGVLPDYRWVAGEACGTAFEVEVWVGDRCWGRGGGKSKKAAEMAAAAAAYEQLQARSTEDLAQSSESVSR